MLAKNPNPEKLFKKVALLILYSNSRYERMLQRTGSKSSSKLKSSPILVAQSLPNFSKEEQDSANLLYDVTMEIFNRLYYKMYASDLGMLRSMFVHGFEGRPFSFLEVKFFESMDRFVITELMFKMFRIHNINDVKVTQVLAKHNVPRLIGLYQSLVCKVKSINPFLDFDPILKFDPFPDFIQFFFFLIISFFKNQNLVMFSFISFHCI